MNPRDYLLNSFTAAIKAADPLNLVPQHLPNPPKGKTFVVGAGKAAAAMALATENAWPQDKPLEGIVVTRYGHALPTQRIKVMEAGHPIPDSNGEYAAKQILCAVKTLTNDDLLICLLSGGGSSLLSLPIQGITLKDLQDITRQLLNCGANIQEINTIRKHLSMIQGGRLASICKVPILALIISDVTGDAATHVASGPCAPDPTTCAEALAIIHHYNLEVSSNIIAALSAPNGTNETPKPNNSIFDHVENRIIATARQSLDAAAQYFREIGIDSLILGDTVTGEAREIAKCHAALVREIKFHPQQLKAPIALLSGGETSVTVKGNGRGGRNTEFLLSLLIALDGMTDVHALACDTDGIDGSEDNAGAIIAPDSLTRAMNNGLNPASSLFNNDAHSFFAKLGDLVVTGPTYTNVNDYRVILLF
ncbi:MAG TPA: glycerate kinase [Nitrosomonas sp.]|nr:glycerate kinase [Nitrosomonas sp.]HRB31809.1 glycerate kinase [Nitrosomonas sp.]HRB44643.1 glycerate kinase [Nitrosomonas sp.]HRB76744.1 glycerate kinase [Nitrosomonas sp.]